jgi:glycogen operon protein
MEHNFHLEIGNTYPLGASLIIDNGKDKSNLSNESKVNFAVYSPQAKQVYLCLFDNTGNKEIAKLALHKNSNHVWSGLVYGIGYGQLYGLRVAGQYQPECGLWFQENNLLLDPYAKDSHGDFRYADSVTNNHGQDTDTENEQISEQAFEEQSERVFIGNVFIDNAGDIPKSKVISLPSYAELYKDGSDKYIQTNSQCLKPNIPWKETVIYECHVKGATINNPEISQEHRGKFLGLSEPAFIHKLKALGVTSLELLPVQSFISERFLFDKGLTNYWGYNSVNFFSPQREFLTDGDVGEFQKMVKTLHQHNIEVILDVVYNHTAEGNEHGPTINLRGLANSDYYRLDSNDKQLYLNETGCGNTLNLSHPRTLQLVMDSLRYWVEVMGVDGFRFDLATTLARDLNGFNYQHTFFQAIAQDPILNQIKLIAEPWDIGIGGYQLGAFPLGWREWNDKYRDTVRRFWRGDLGQVADLAKHLHGSHEVFAHNGRDASSSINFISAHDGFTLADIVSYNDKHNEANGEENRDGHSENLSNNYGIEGGTDSSEINALRLQQQKNMLLTLLFSQGVPMISAGSEQGHSQLGNNNAYCQDNTLNYLNYTKPFFDLQSFIPEAIKLRNQFEIFQQSQFVHDEDENFDWLWLSDQGEVMTEQDWLNQENQLLICLITNKNSSPNYNENDALLMVFNAANINVNFQLPAVEGVSHWQTRLDTLAQPSNKTLYIPEQNINIPAQSTWLMSPAKLVI